MPLPVKKPPVIKLALDQTMSAMDVPMVSSPYEKPSFGDQLTFGSGEEDFDLDLLLGEDLPSDELRTLGEEDKFPGFSPPSSPQAPDGLQEETDAYLSLLWAQQQHAPLGGSPHAEQQPIAMPPGHNRVISTETSVGSTAACSPVSGSPPAGFMAPRALPYSLSAGSSPPGAGAGAGLAALMQCMRGAASQLAQHAVRASSASGSESGPLFPRASLAELTASPAPIYPPASLSSLSPAAATVPAVARPRSAEDVRVGGKHERALLEEKRKESNRVAQRKHREKYRAEVASARAEAERLRLENQALKDRLRQVEQVCLQLGAAQVTAAAARQMHSQQQL